MMKFVAIINALRPTKAVPVANRAVSLRFCLIILQLILSVSLLHAQEWKTYPYTPEGSLISFPSDEGWHPGEEVEWWYMAGHLNGNTTGTPYSFMVTYFYYPYTIDPYTFDGFRILNISNDATGEFHSDIMPVYYRDLATDHLHIDALLFNQLTESWDHKEEGGIRIPFEYELSAQSSKDALQLSSIANKNPLIPGGTGLFNQGASSYTYYYSLTRNWVEGSLTFNGVQDDDVSGTVWIDRQYGNFNPNTSENYEWFYVQLSNGMDLNIWNIFNAESQVPDDPAYRHLSAWVDESTQFTTHEFEMERLEYNTINESGNTYASAWRLTSAHYQMDLEISIQHENTEVPFIFHFYEGSTTISGTINGQAVYGVGFAELLQQWPNVSVNPEKTRVKSKIWPNPVSTTLWVTNNHEKAIPYRILDLNGREILHGMLNRQTIDVSQVSKGAYILILGNEWRDTHLLIKQ